MDSSFDFLPAICSAAFRIGIISAMELSNISLRVFYDALTLDDVRVPETHLFAGREAEIFRRRNLLEIVLLDINFFGERNLSRSRRWIFRIINSIKLFDLTIGIIIDDNFNRPQDGHYAQRVLIQILPDAMFEQ